MASWACRALIVSRDYKLNFLYIHRRRLVRRQIGPHKNPPNIERLGISTFHRCQTPVPVLGRIELSTSDGLRVSQRSTTAGPYTIACFESLMRQLAQEKVKRC
jgi:hypothetical protein